MQQLTYGVLGAGEVGPAIALWLLRQRDTSKVTIADADLPRAIRATHRIASAEDIRNGRCVAIQLDVWAADEPTIQEFFGGADCIISAIPASHSPLLADLAIKFGSHFCDLGGVTAISQKLRSELAQQAQDAGKSIVHDCGFAPGLSNQMTQVLFHYLEGAERIITYVGGLPQRPQKAAHYWQRTFSAKGLVEILGPSQVLQKGQLVTVDSCSGGTTLEIPSLAEHFPTEFGSTVKTRITAGAGVAPEIMYKLGVKDCWEETIRWDWDAFLQFIEMVPPDQRVQVLEEELPHTSAEFPDIAVMRVVATNGDKTAAYDLMDAYDSTLSMSAMARVTGFSAAAVAKLAAQGGTPPGVMAPEELPWKTNGALIARLSEDLDIWFRS